ncbi:MAG: hypothetical protein LBL83_01360 [Clostridiales bacterium]|jgi:hypothetical protein|nr:hypothetical protein [Clostridiales bacterium]
MKDSYDFSSGRKNPYAKKLKEEGYAITIHYGPEDIKELNGAKECEPAADEIAAFEEYRAANAAK